MGDPPNLLPVHASSGAQLAERRAFGQVPHGAECVQVVNRPNYGILHMLKAWHTPGQGARVFLSDGVRTFGFKADFSAAEIEGVAVAHFRTFVLSDFAAAAAVALALGVDRFFN